MPKFIIGYGLSANVDVIEATSLEAALDEAAGRSAIDGIGREETDWFWAEPFAEHIAYDLGLLDPPTQRDERQAPWWG